MAVVTEELSDFADWIQTGTLGVHGKERAQGECINFLLIIVTLLSADANKKVAVTPWEELPHWEKMCMSANLKKKKVHQ